jgi:hypothetical protein
MKLAFRKLKYLKPYLKKLTDYKGKFVAYKIGLFFFELIIYSNEYYYENRYTTGHGNIHEEIKNIFTICLTFVYCLLYISL